MRLPFVSRERYDEARSAYDRLAAEKDRADERWFQILQHATAEHRGTLEKYHALRVAGANPAEPAVVIPPPKMPPREILNAIRAISPREDATFAANMKLYRDHQEEADMDPEAFAERIKRGRLEPAPQSADAGDEGAA